MAEETLPIADYTVIWRPDPETEFRGDHVKALADDQSSIINAAFSIYNKETGQQASDGTTSYDLCAILEGHAKFFY